MLTRMLDDMPGQIRWIDMTAEDAPSLRDFYEAVVGWRSEAVKMAGYEDWCMVPEGAKDPVAGICHARGPNEGLPSGWLIYITVADLQVSMAECRERGGEVVFGPKTYGTQGTWCIIRDPAGSHAALFEPKAVA